MSTFNNNKRDVNLIYALCVKRAKRSILEIAAITMGDRERGGGGERRNQGGNRDRRNKGSGAGGGRENRDRGDGAGGQGQRRDGGRNRRDRDRGSRRNEEDAAGGMGRPVILAKPQSDRQRNLEFPTLEQASRPLQKEEGRGTPDFATGANRVKIESRSESSATKEATNETRNSEEQQGSNPAPSGGGVQVPDRSCKLIDDQHTVSEGILSFLTDNTEFLVVGVIGLQNVGKSTICNALASIVDGDYSYNPLKRSEIGYVSVFPVSTFK